MTNNLTEIVTYYKQNGAPSDQSALLSCLREAQEACGGMLDSQHSRKLLLCSVSNPIICKPLQNAFPTSSYPVQHIH